MERRLERKLSRYLHPILVHPRVPKPPLNGTSRALYKPPSSRRKFAFQRGLKAYKTGEGRGRGGKGRQQSNSVTLCRSVACIYRVGDVLESATILSPARRREAATEQDRDGWKRSGRERGMGRGWEEKGEKERDPDFIFVDELGTGPTRTKYILPFSSSLSISCSTPPLPCCTFSFSFLHGLSPVCDQETVDRVLNYNLILQFRVKFTRSLLRVIISIRWIKKNSEGKNR